MSDSVESIERLSQESGLVGVIIVTHNASKWLSDCLISVLASTVPVLPIVVDNGSSDGTIEIAKSFHASISLLTQEKNIGFGRANNIGIGCALRNGCEYVFLLNQDAHIEPETIERLVEQASHGEHGILSPIHLNRSGESFDPNFAHHLINYGGISLFSDLYLRSTLKPVYSVRFVNAAAWLLTKDFLLAVGGFDPLFFMYAEDDDLCDRAVLHNFQIGVVPSSRAYHYREKSSVAASEQQAMSFSRWNRIYSHMILRLKRTRRPLWVDFARLTVGTLLSLVHIFATVRLADAFAHLRAYAALLQKLPTLSRNRTLSRMEGSHWIPT